MPDVFNSFFTSVLSNSQVEHTECTRFKDKTFANLKRIKKVNTPGFSFKLVDRFEVDKVIKELSKTSSPGVSAIPKQILKDISPCTSSILA